MKNMKLRKLSLLSNVEKRARQEIFDPEDTVIFGGNDVGKSHLIKSIYSAFGAEPTVVNDKWKRADAMIAVEFSVNDTMFTIVRVHNQFALFDSNRELLWSESFLVKEVGPRIAKLLDFTIELPTKEEVLVVPPPQFCFLPFYQDQDRGWNDLWASFKHVAMIPDYRRSLLEYHTGIRPREYYVAKAAKAEASRKQAEFRAERNALDRATERLRAGRAPLGVPFEPEQFSEQIERLLTELNEIGALYEQVRKRVAGLQSQRAVLVEQIEIADGALRELDADFRYMQDVSEGEIVCPTCHATYDNDFAHRFGLIGDADACRGFLASARQSLGEVERDITSQQRSMAQYQGKARQIEAILSETRGKIKLGDMLKDESERILDGTIAVERESIQRSINEWLGKEHDADETMQAYTRPKRKKEIIEFYAGKLASFAQELGVAFGPDVYKTVSPKIRETGSYGTRAVLAYHYALLHTIRRFTSSCLAPIILDTPLQQDQDKHNAEAILTFIRDRKPDDMQLVLGTVSLHGVSYPGRKIQPDIEFKLLDEDAYEAVSEYIAPLFNQMMNPGAGAPLL